MNLILAAEGPNGAWLPADILEFWWSAGAFFIVLALLLWKVLPQAKAGLAARSDGIREDLVEADRARVGAEAELTELKSKLGDAEAESARIKAEAHETAASLKAEMIARADADAEAARARAQEDVGSSTAQAAGDVQAAVAEQAVAAAESVINANLDDQTHADLIDRYIQQVNAS